MISNPNIQISFEYMANTTIANMNHKQLWTSLNQECSEPIGHSNYRDITPWADSGRNINFCDCEHNRKMCRYQKDKSIINNIGGGNNKIEGDKEVDSNSEYEKEISDDQIQIVPITEQSNNDERKSGFDYAEEIKVESLSLHDKELELIKKSLEKHKGRRKLAAKELGISERTLYRKIKQFNL